MEFEELKGVRALNALFFAITICAICLNYKILFPRPLVDLPKTSSGPCACLMTS